jgi:excisionase family DNA binding protein
MAKPLPTVYRVAEAARLLALQPDTIRKLIAQGHIAVCRPSPRSVRVPETEIARLLRVASRRGARAQRGSAT